MPPKAPPTIHARVLNQRVGIASIPLDQIEMHENHRPPKESHVLRLKEELSQDVNTRWAHPIDIVIGTKVPNKWIKSLQANRLVLDPPATGRFICIGGQHRLLAARMLLEEWEPSEESPEMDPSLSAYPATIYEEDILDDEELSVWMVERNVLRLSLKVTLLQRLAVISDLRPVSLQLKALGLLGWTSKDAACIVSIRQSSAWEGLISLLQEPLYEDIASGTIVDWAIEYRSYPMLTFMIRDMLQQQRQLREMAKEDTIITMDLLFGANSAQNQHIRKTGTHYIISAVWNTVPNQPWAHFDVESFIQLWRGATQRNVEIDGLVEDSLFLFGAMIPSIHDVNYHSFDSPFSDRMHRSEIAASMLHILTSYPRMTSLPTRRPNKAKNELDWVEILDRKAVRTLTKPDRSRGEKIILYILSNLNLLVPPGNYTQAFQKSELLPHMIVLEDETELGAYVKDTMTPAWNALILLCSTLGIKVGKEVTGLRRDLLGATPLPRSPTLEASEALSNSDSGEIEAPPVPAAPAPVAKISTQKHKNANRRPKGLLITRTSPGGTILDQQYATVRAGQSSRKEKAPRQDPTSPRDSTPPRDPAPRKAPAPPRDSTPPMELSPRKAPAPPNDSTPPRDPAPRKATAPRKAPAPPKNSAPPKSSTPRKAPALPKNKADRKHPDPPSDYGLSSQSAIEDEDEHASGTDTTPVRKNPEPLGESDVNVPSSQALVVLEDEQGRYWDSYRLANSPGGARFLHAGRAYQNGETGRIHVARPAFVLGKHPLEDGEYSPATRKRFEQDEEAFALQHDERTPSQVFIAFAARLQRLNTNEADSVLAGAEVGHEDIVRWHEELDGFMIEDE